MRMIRFSQPVLDLPVTRDGLQHAGHRISVPIVLAAVPYQLAADAFDRSDQFERASWHGQLADLSDPGEFATFDVSIEVLEMFDQVVEGFTLGPIVGMVLQIAKPGVLVLPIHVFDRMHVHSLRGVLVLYRR